MSAMDERDRKQEPQDPQDAGAAQHERLCAYVLGELDSAERAGLERELAESEELRAERALLEGTIGLVKTALPRDELSPAVRETLRQAAERGPGAASVDGKANERRSLFRLLAGGPVLRAAAGIAVAIGATITVWKLVPEESTSRTGVARLTDGEKTRRFKKEASAGDELGLNARGVTSSSLDGEAAPPAVGPGLSNLLAPDGSVAFPNNLDPSVQGSVLIPPLGYSEAKAGDESARTGLRALGYGGSEKETDPLRLSFDVNDLPAESPALGKPTGSQYVGPGDTVPGNAARLEELGYAGVEVVGADEAARPTVAFLDGGEAVLRASEGYDPEQGDADEIARYLEPATALPKDEMEAKSPAVPGSAGPGSPGSGAGPSSPGPVAAIPPSRAAPILAGQAPSAGRNSDGELQDQLRALGYFVEPATEATDGEQEEAPGFLSDSPFDSDEFNALITGRLRDIGYVDEQDAAERAYTAGVNFRRTPDDRRPVTPEQNAEHLIRSCLPRPEETPSQSFFRFWGEHPFQATQLDPQSTFAADVDTASYALARRTLQAGRLPEVAQVRLEEFVNYFKADVPAPQQGAFRIDCELAPSRFGEGNDAWMMRVAVRGADVDELDRQPLALTFVVDVSGSMEDENRLVLVKQALKELLARLSVTDSVAIVSFAKEANVVAEMVSAANARGLLEDRIDALVAQGGTNVEKGLQRGFQLAADSLTPGAVNRVVFLSDGVGNIGETKQANILASAADYRAKGLYLNTVGVGLEGINDDFLEQLANRGDGICDYVDSERSVRRALVENFTGAFQPIARDVKIQVEFDPSLVREYRQLGYENRAIADADFRNDAVDAGEINAGHQVTALYELRLAPGAAARPSELAMIRVRHKEPFAVDRGELSEAATAAAEVATEIEGLLLPEDVSTSWLGTTPGFRRAVLVAQFAELLRRSVHTHIDTPEELLVEAEALAPILNDADFTEFVELVRLALPLLNEERGRRDPELLRLLRELSESSYRQGQSELLGEEPDDEERARRLAELQALQDQIRGHLVPEPPAPRELSPEEVGEMRKLGYTDNDDDER